MLPPGASLYVRTSRTFYQWPESAIATGPSWGAAHGLEVLNLRQFKMRLKRRHIPEISSTSTKEHIGSLKGQPAKSDHPISQEANPGNRDKQPSYQRRKRPNTMKELRHCIHPSYFDAFRPCASPAVSSTAEC